MLYKLMSPSEAIKFCIKEFGEDKYKTLHCLTVTKRGVYWHNSIKSTYNLDSMFSIDRQIIFIDRDFCYWLYIQSGEYLPAKEFSFLMLSEVTEEERI